MKLWKQGGREDLSYTLEMKLNVQTGFGAVFYKWQDCIHFESFTSLCISCICKCQVEENKGKWINILAHSST